MEGIIIITFFYKGIKIRFYDSFLTERDYSDFDEVGHSI